VPHRGVVGGGGAERRSDQAGGDGEAEAADSDGGGTSQTGRRRGHVRPSCGVSGYLQRSVDLVSSAPTDEAGEYRQYRFTPPPGAADLLIVRHGESAPAREDRPADSVDGQSDPPLDPVGEDQAGRLANRLALGVVDAIYVTPLRRTAQTAAPLTERLGLTPVVEPDLREVHLGEWEGAAFRKHTREGHPMAVQAFTEQRWDVIPGAESMNAFATRVRRGITRIAGVHPNQRVVVVVHGGVIGMIMAMATGAQNFAFVGADNASISELVVLGDRWHVRRFNDVAHLDPAVAETPLGGR
jgi:2,3-bisphosphoglycerate-dependent phosphoglycerate mutase